MATRCGGTTAAEDATPDTQLIIEQVKECAEEKTGKKFDTYEAKKVAKQIVAGVNYFVKVHIGDNDHLHLRIYKNLQGETSLHSLQESKTLEDELTYF